YAVEARQLAPITRAFVVGPEGVLTRGDAMTAVGQISIGTPQDIHDILTEVFRATYAGPQV
ncbi:MAG TPA: hypothetical protein VF911_05720, partial [Thermoanaerobaculia bacterium]